MCKDCVPPNTAAIAWLVTLITLLSGCWAVNVEPPVCVWNRSICALGSVAPKDFVICAHILLAALNFAISSKKLLWQLKKKDNRFAKILISKPFSKAAFK